MTTVSLQNTYIAAGYTVAAGVTLLDLQATATVAGAGVIAAAPLDVGNVGRIVAKGAGAGVALESGGRVNNGGGGVIGGRTGVVATGAAGYVQNESVIAATIGDGVQFYDGGTVVNGGDTYAGASITAGGSAIYITNLAGTVANYGTVVSTQQSAANLAGGLVTNGDLSDPTALMRGGTYGLLAAGSGTVANFGTLQGLHDDGAYLGGGTVTNGDVGDTTATIAGGHSGVDETADATVHNFGTITGASGDGIDLNISGAVINGALTDQTALIRGFAGVEVGSGIGSVSNFGTIASVGSTGRGIYLAAGGGVTNGAISDTGATVVGATGVGLKLHGTMTNFGVIDGESTSGVYLAAGGTVINGANADAKSAIEGAVYGLDLIKSSVVENFGAINAGATAVYIAAGAVINGSLTDHAALIDGGVTGIFSSGAGTNDGAAATVVNFGSIVGAGQSGAGVYLASGGGVTNGATTDRAASIFGAVGVKLAAAGAVANFGTIEAGAGDAVLLESGGVVTNGAGTDASALIEGASGVVAYGGSATLTNLGVASGDSVFGAGAYLHAGGAVTNGSIIDTSARIGGYGGLLVSGGAAVVANFGTIASTGGANYAGVIIDAGGSVTNGSSKDSKALIIGYTGFVASNQAATLTNFGNITGIDGIAVDLNSSSDTLVVEAGSVFQGAVLGGGGSLILANGAGAIGGMFGLDGVTVSGSMMSTTFQGFDILEVAAGASFTDTDAAIGIAAGDKLIDDGALTLSGTLANTGQIDINGGGLTVAGAGVSLTGAGAVVLSNSAFNQIIGANSASTLTLGQKLTGSGDIGEGAMTLSITSAGTIISTGGVALILDTGGNAIVSAGRLYAEGTGGLTINSAIANTGTIVAYSALLTVNGAVTGTGHAQINSGVLDFTSTSNFSQNVVFSAGSTGALELAHGQTYAGTISGFSLTGATALDLGDIIYAAGTTKATYSGTTSGGVLTVTDGTHTEQIHFTGNYLGSAWILSAAAGGGTQIVDPPKAPAASGGTHPSVPVMPTHPFIQAMASIGTAGGLSGPVSPEAFDHSARALAGPSVARA